ncbi:hypothetical protein [Profundibacter sp.]
MYLEITANGQAPVMRQNQILCASPVIIHSALGAVLASTSKHRCERYLMTTHNLYGYGNSAFAYNSNTGQFDLDGGFDHTVDRIHVSFTDDDSHLDGDLGNKS